ncbi:MAG: extracellular solute-binding protein, partial [Clostridia bacterium]
FMDNENFADLSTFIARDGMGEVWSANTIANIYTNSAGKVLAVPFISKVFAMAYNKTLFDEAGLAYPTDDWTVEDMLTAARALTKGTGVDAQYGLRWGVRPTEFYRNLYGTPVYNVGSQEINAVDNAGFKAALDLFTQTIAEGLAPNEASGAISTGGFETGRFGMQLSATWDIATLLNLADSSFEWDVVMLPINAELNQRMMTTYRGNGWCMNANTKQQEVCWDFIKFMSANEDAQRLAQAFGIPELTSFANSEEYLKDFGTSTITYDKSVFLRMLENSVGFCNMGVYAQINDVMKNEYELVLAGKQTVDQMVINVQEQADALMAMPQ